MDIRKLQRAIVDGLEDVKAQDIVVFNTEHLSPLFERVIIASGTSNRQTKALASSVREAVKAHGERVLGVEGEDNGEWIIVDCGAAVAHIMQPAIRDYYRLEEIWGDKPVRMKLGSPAPKGLPKASEEADSPPEGASTVSARGRGAARPKRQAEPADDAKPAPRKARAAAAKTSKASKPAQAAKPAKPAKPAKAPAAGTRKPVTKAAPRPAPKPAAKSGTKPATPAAARKAPSRAGNAARKGGKPAERKVMVAAPRSGSARPRTAAPARPARKTSR